MRVDIYTGVKRCASSRDRFDDFESTAISERPTSADTKIRRDIFQLDTMKQSYFSHTGKRSLQRHVTTRDGRSVYGVFLFIYFLPAVTRSLFLRLAPRRWVVAAGETTDAEGRARDVPRVPRSRATHTPGPRRTVIIHREPRDLCIIHVLRVRSAPPVFSPFPTTNRSVYRRRRIAS